MDKKPVETKVPKKNGRPKGSTKINVDDAFIKQVSTMRGLGLTQAQIATCIGVDEDTFTRMLKENPKLFTEIKAAKEKAKLAVMQTAHKMATSGKSAQMTTFWLRTQAGWKEEIDVKVDNRLTVVFETEFKNGSLRQSATELPIDEGKAVDDIVDALIEDLDG